MPVNRIFPRLGPGDPEAAFMAAVISYLSPKQREGMFRRSKPRIHEVSETHYWRNLPYGCFEEPDGNHVVFDRWSTPLVRLFPNGKRQLVAILSARDH